MDFVISMKYVLAGLVTMLGATVHATIQWKKARSKEEIHFSFVDFLILLLISAFSGLMFGLLALIFFDDNTPVFLMAFGLGSLSGLEGLNRISIAFLERILKEIKK